MPSLWHPNSKHIEPPDTVIRDIEEIRNCIILGFSVCLLNREQFSYTIEEPTEILQKRNGLIIKFKDCSAFYAHDLGIDDPSFNPDMGSSPYDMLLFSSQEDTATFLLHLREVAISL